MSSEPTWHLKPPTRTPDPDAVRRLNLAKERGYHACISSTGYGCMVWVPTDTVSGGHWRSWWPPEERGDIEELRSALARASIGADDAG